MWYHKPSPSNKFEDFQPQLPFLWLSWNRDTSEQVLEITSWAWDEYISLDAISYKDKEISFWGFENLWEGFYIAKITIGFKKEVPFRIQFCFEGQDIKFLWFSLWKTKDRDTDMLLDDKEIRKIISYLTWTKYWDFFIHKHINSDSKHNEYEENKKTKHIGNISLENGLDYKNISITPYYEKYFVDFTLGAYSYRVRINPSKERKIQGIFEKYWENFYTEIKDLDFKQLTKVIHLIHYIVENKGVYL